MGSNIVLSNIEYKVVGKRPIRHDGYDKVTGRAQYGADVNLPGLFYGQILRSPHAHARIVSIDTSKAEAHPEVRAVVTSADLPPAPDEPAVLGSGPPVNLHQVSSNILARGKVLYKGHAVAALAASSAHAAEEALSLIDVQYEVLPSVTNVEDAMKADAPLLHDRFDGNVAAHSQLALGDVEKGFAEADVVIEREYRTKTVHQGYIEPQSATAWWLPNDKLTIWSSSQGHFPARERTAGVLGIPPFRIKVVPMEIGGGFGGKTTVYLEPVAAILSRKSGHPVKITMTRADVLEATGPTAGTYMKVKMGATREGKLIAAEARLMFEAGAFPGSPVAAAAQCMFSPYDIENVLIDAYDVVDNKPKTTAYRAPGAPLGALAVETIVDEICERLSIDLLDFRILNGAKEGTRRATGLINPPIGCIETAEAVKAHEHYSAPLEGPNRGRGVASGFWINGTGPACATANVNFDGTVNLIIGQMDIGGTRPVAAQQFAEVLGIPVEDVNPQVGDTESIGFTSMTGGSGAAFKTGWASFEAAQDVKQQMIERAALLWDRAADEIELIDGVFQHTSDPELKIGFKELATNLPDTGGPVVGKANIDPPGAGSAFATHIVDVEVDPETGKVTILRYTAAQDAGKAVHPSYVEGQIQGGVVQGIGWALNEEYCMSDDGRMLNPSLLDYRMPTSLDLPMIDTIIVEVANPSHPYGVRGVGEIPIVPPLAAIANAIYDAVGIRMTDLPMNPASIVKALAEKDGK
ncbi:MAG: xanthine dehydrogenase family protein molybdopterin-binding subunit [Chloroflexi bacterium]|nr:xanthine dehydrogenase family protein molybdopterin-binding subunit [Chloroflexota bacterium]